MNRKHKAYIKLNIMSLFFIAISSISVTLAWFAYSGLAKVSTDIDIKSWLIEFEKNKETVSNDIVISLDDIYPGMGTLKESIKIKNKGDSDAKLSYSIDSIRILDKEISTKDIEQDVLNDMLSHDYPFSINISLSDNFILARGGESEIELSVSWPLDSGNDARDSEWGNLAYQFGVNEQNILKEDSTYQVRPSLRVVVGAKAEQLIESKDTYESNDVNLFGGVDIEQPLEGKGPSDINYPLGSMILYDIKSNKRCEVLSETCIRTHVIDINNKVDDISVTLLADLFGNYESGTFDNYNKLFSDSVKGWSVNYRSLIIDDVLKIISKDIDNSLIVRDGLSNSVIGYVNSNARINNIIGITVPYNGYYSFLNEEFNYLVTNKCYWLNREYDTNRAFALTKNDDETSIGYGELKSTECSVAPVILAPKVNLKINNEEDE